MGGQLPPIEGQARNEDGYEGDDDNGHGKTGPGEMVPGWDGLKNTSANEGECNGVGANHPLAMVLNVTIACGEEGSARGDHPRSSLDDVCCEKVSGLRGCLAAGHGDGEWRGGEDSANINTSEYPMKFWVSTAESAGELEWAGEQRSEPGDDMRNEQPGNGVQ